MGKRGVPHEPDNEKRRLVKRGVALGLTQLQLSKMLDVSVPTLERKYRTELDSGQAEAVLNVASRLYKQAMSEADTMANTTARIYFLKARGAGNWRDVQTVEHANADGSPMNANRQVVVVLPSNGREMPAPALTRPQVIDVQSVEISGG